MIKGGRGKFAMSTYDVALSTMGDLDTLLVSAVRGYSHAGNHYDLFKGDWIKMTWEDYFSLLSRQIEMKLFYLIFSI